MGPAGVALEDLKWAEAARVLTPEASILLPVGAAAKQHGLHLPLKNDRLLAEALARRIVDQRPVVAIPTLGFHHYPAFVEYPGSISLRFETARDLTVDVVRSVAAHGPRRFYALNTGISTLGPLQAAASALRSEGILLRATDWGATLDTAARGLVRQEGGTHADEVETSLMQVLAPEAVDMTRAQRDFQPKGRGGLSPRPGGPKTFSPTGAWGDPTLATPETGRAILDRLMPLLLAEIDELARTPAPFPA